MKLSLLITAWKEEKTIAKCIRCLIDPQYSGFSGDFEIMLAAPDEPTRLAAEQEIEKLGAREKYTYLKDPGLGKPHALNMLVNKAKGNIWVFTDGDVYFGKDAVKELIKPFGDDAKRTTAPMLVTGRPRSADEKNTMMGYFGNLLSDAAHHKRTVTLQFNDSGRGTAFVSKDPFFPVSGYIYASNNLKKAFSETFNSKTTPVGAEYIQHLQTKGKTENQNFNLFPTDCLVDDAYVSYLVHNAGGQIKYTPAAEVFVKYPKTLKDYFTQKRRSAGGYVQLWKYGVVKEETVTRSFKKEIQYFWFPIKYAKSIKQFFWSLMLYPIRFLQWVWIMWDLKIRKKEDVWSDDAEATLWGRVESTK